VATPASILHIPGFTYPVTQFYKQHFEYNLRRQQYEYLRSINRKPAGSGGPAEDMDDDDNEYSSRQRFNFSDFEEWEAHRKHRQQQAISRQQGGRGGPLDTIDYDLIVQMICRLGCGDVFDVDAQSQSQQETQEHSLESLQTMLQTAVGGCILVFMPGVPEITKLMNTLKTAWDAVTRVSSKRAPMLKLYALHGNLSPNEQKAVFQVAGRNELKVVVSTNVAEVHLCCLL
jgi:HrpA-like RNA helicase